MNTLDELVYYCNEDNPVGAFMLTGEWGCGKTYLLEHQLADELKETHILVRVSLFGVSSIDNLHLLVKRQWVNKCMPFWGKVQNDDTVRKSGKLAFDTVANLIPYLKDIKDLILQINPLDYITIKSETEADRKKVILIFDDLERCKLDTVDVLGCINEYCENQGFGTIIIANEDKIIDSRGKQECNASYQEIKEKIVARTVKYAPNYETIINSLLNKQIWMDEDYTSFLHENEKILLNVIASNSENTSENYNYQIHNIRTLKCALHDFYRVYSKLKIAKLPNVDMYLYAFVAFTMAARGGKLSDKDAVSFNKQKKDLKGIYPHFDEKYIFHSVQSWIFHGVWDSKSFDQELQLVTSQINLSEPKAILRNSNFFECEEKTVQEGFEGLLEDAYNGKLNFNEYVNLINNSRYIREYDILISKPIDWNEIKKGMDLRFNIEVNAYDYDRYSFKFVINEEDTSKYTEEEYNAYKLIEYYRDNKLIYGRNRMLFLRKLKEVGVDAFLECKNKILDVFDEKMAIETVFCFKNCANYDKAYFKLYFYKIWESCDSSTYVKKSETKVGFEKLVDLLEEAKVDYKAEGKNIATKHTDNFKESIVKLIEKLDKVISDNEINDI